MQHIAFSYISFAFPLWAVPKKFTHLSKNVDLHGAAPVGRLDLARVLWTYSYLLSKSKHFPYTPFSESFPYHVVRISRMLHFIDPFNCPGGKKSFSIAERFAKFSCWSVLMLSPPRSSLFLPMHKKPAPTESLTPLLTEVHGIVPIHINGSAQTCMPCPEAPNYISRSNAVIVITALHAEHDLRSIQSPSEHLAAW